MCVITPCENIPARPPGGFPRRMPPPASKSPAKKPLPGGYKVGEKVFYTLSSETWDDGDKVVHGQQVEVRGSGTRKNGKERVAVRFPGNKDLIICYLTSVRRLRAAPAANLHACAPRQARPDSMSPLSSSI